ncbi:hypothetical protein [Natranaerofaba carboxydovora]|uniref:hypothetical protein n=1 Tax=Natranaerofaba carboxydovora TaxID=2742683 RepID=UPI001F1477C0|nr:hypothetical protein [Natranaerofaba carboxydovora]
MSKIRSYEILILLLITVLLSIFLSAFYYLSNNETPPRDSKRVLIEITETN